MSIASRCELCGRDVRVPDYHTGPSQEYCVACEENTVEYRSGIQYFRAHPEQPGLSIMRVDGKETTVKILGKDKIVKLPDIPVPGRHAPHEIKAMLDVDRGFTRKLPKGRRHTPPEGYDDKGDALLAALNLLHSKLGGQILDRKTIHFLLCSADDAAELLTEKDIKFLAYAGIKVSDDEDGRRFYADVIR